MAELLGLGCSHGPIILTPPEVWAKGRERVMARVPGYEPPAQLLKELGDDNGLSQDISDHQKVVESFKVLRNRLHEWEPDVLMVIGDDQAENFLQDNLPPFCLYTGAEVDGYPFQRPAARTNLWDAAPETKFTFQCPKEFARGLRKLPDPGRVRYVLFQRAQGMGLGPGPRHHQPAGVSGPRRQIPPAAPVRQLLRRRGPDPITRRGPRRNGATNWDRASAGSWTPGTNGWPW